MIGMQHAIRTVDVMETVGRHSKQRPVIWIVFFMSSLRKEGKDNINHDTVISYLSKKRQDEK